MKISTDKTNILEELKLYQIKKTIEHI